MFELILIDDQNHHENDHENDDVTLAFRHLAHREKQENEERAGLTEILKFKDRFIKYSNYSSLPPKMPL